MKHLPVPVPRSTATPPLYPILVALATMAREHFIPAARGKRIGKLSAVEKALNNALDSLPGSNPTITIDVKIRVVPIAYGRTELAGGMMRVAVEGPRHAHGLVLYVAEGLSAGACPWIAAEVLATARTIEVLVEDERMLRYLDGEAPFRIRGELQSLLDGAFMNGMRFALEKLNARDGLGLPLVQKFLLDCEKTGKDSSAPALMHFAVKATQMPRPAEFAQAIAFAGVVLTIARAPEAPEIPAPALPN